MNFSYGFIFGFFFGLVSIYTAINSNAPKTEENTHYGVNHRGNLDTIYKIERTQEGFSYSDIINN